MRLKRTVTKPAFLMPLTNPKFDVDVSAAMVNGGAVEMGLSQVCHACDGVLSCHSSTLACLDDRTLPCIDLVYKKIQP